MTEKEMNEFFATAEIDGYDGMNIERLYQAFKRRIASECALNLFPNEVDK